MSRFRMLATISLGGLLLLATTVTRASTVTCESRNDAYQSCPVDTSHGVRLSRQLSSQGCWEGDTWGYDRNRIWVNRGCRAEFEVGGTSSNSSSANNAIAAAAVVGIAAAAVIASNKHHNQHHNKNNDGYNDNYNYNYGYSNSHYDSYYDRYDDSYYANTRYGYNGYRGDPRRVFNCESRGDRKNYCDIPKRGHVEVYRQLSASPCTYGRSWGVDGNSVWVTKGCRAEFAVF